MHTDPKIHLSRFHEFVMRDAKPEEIAKSFDQLHADLIPLQETIRAAEEALEVKRDEIANFIRLHRLKSHPKPQDYDPAKYTALLNELASGARQRSGVMPERPKRKICEMRPQTLPSHRPGEGQSLRVSMMELINRHKPKPDPISPQ